MNELLPIIAELADAKSHLRRAEWLLSCPIVYLRQYDMAIRNRLYHAGFHMGVAYLDDMFVHMCATRDRETGAFRLETQEAIATLGAMMLRAAERMDAEAGRERDPGPAPDHSITEL